MTSLICSFMETSKLREVADPNYLPSDDVCHNIINVCNCLM